VHPEEKAAVRKGVFELGEVAAQGGVHSITTGSVFGAQMVDVAIEVAGADQIQDQGGGEGAHATTAVERTTAYQACMTERWAWTQPDRRPGARIFEKELIEMTLCC